MWIQIGNGFDGPAGDQRWWQCGGVGNTGTVTHFIFDDWTEIERQNIAGQWAHVRVGSNKAEMGAFDVERSCVGSSTFNCVTPFTQSWDSNQIAYDEYENGVCGNNTAPIGTCDGFCGPDTSDTCVAQDTQDGCENLAGCIALLVKYF